MFGTRFVPGAELSLDMTGDVRPSCSLRRIARYDIHPTPTCITRLVGQWEVVTCNLSGRTTSRSVRLGLTPDRLYSIQVEQAFFHRQGHDLIDCSRPNGSLTTYAINLREATFTGLEMVVNVMPNEALGGSGAVPRLGFTTMEASESSAGFESNYVLDGLKTKADALSALWCRATCG